MAVNVKLGVDMSAFKSGIQEANAQLKTFDAQLKFAETTFKKTGNAEAAMSTKTDALSNKLKVQKSVVQQYEKALQDMKNAGVDPASKSYQQMQAAMLNMQSAANETEIALNGLSTSQLTAATTADKLTQSVNSIGKKISLDQVISGINKITGALENAAKKAAEVGKEIWNNMMMSAERGDQIATNAAILGMDVEDYQRYVKVFNTVGEITINEWRNAKKKIEKAMTDPSNDQKDALKALGINMIDKIPIEGIRGAYKLVARDWEDVFWDVADELTNRVKNGKLTEAQADVYAQAILGNKYDLYKPLLNLGREEFNKELEEQLVLDQESVNKLATLNDEIIELKGNFETLQDKVLAGLAPALTAGAEALSDLLGKLMQYLNTPKGQQMLENLGTAVSGLFEDLSNIDPQQIVEGFTSVFEKIVGGFQWLYEHKDDVVKALEYIVIGWAGLKLTGGALDVLKVIEGAKNLTVGGSGDGTGTGTGTETTGTETSSGGGFWSNALNKLTLVAIADAMYQATESQIRQNVESFNKATEGMTDQQRNREALKVGFGMTDEEIDTYIDNVNQKLSGEHDILLPTELEPEENAAQKLAEEVGTVTVPASLDWRPSYQQGYQQQAPGFGGHANGLPFVPYDGYLALLHRGERVMTASQNKSYTYNNNTYFGSVNLHNGLEIDALTESIARNNRRKNSGYGA